MKTFFAVLALLLPVLLWSQVTTFRMQYTAPGDTAIDGSMLQAADGGFAFTGRIAQHPVLVKTDAYGAIQWQVIYDSVRVNTVGKLLSGTNGFYICGTTEGANGDPAYFILHTDFAGSIIWTKQYTLGNNFVLTNFPFAIPSGYDHDRRIKADLLTNGSIVLAGFVTQVLTPNTYVQVSCIDPSGNFLWSNMIPVAYRHGYDIAVLRMSAEIPRDKIYVLADDFQTPTLTEFDEAGNEVWIKQYTGLNMGRLSRINVITVTSDNRLIMAGKYYLGNPTPPYTYDLFAIRTDTAGTILWTKSYDLNVDEWTMDAAPLPGGGFVLCGSNSPANGTTSPTLHGIDVNGNLLWSRSYFEAGQPEADFETVVACMDGGFACFGISGTSFSDVRYYLVKTDAQGESNCNDVLNQPVVQGHTLALQAKSPGSIFQMGSAALSFTPATAALSENSICLTIGFEEVNAAQAITVYPVPANNVLTVACDARHFTIDVYNMLGEVVISQNGTRGTNNLYLADLPEGNYTVKVVAEADIYVRKISVVR